MEAVGLTAKKLEVQDAAEAAQVGRGHSSCASSLLLRVLQEGWRAKKLAARPLVLLSPWCAAENAGCIAHRFLLLP